MSYSTFNKTADLVSGDTVSLAAGSNTIGKLAAPTDGTYIGDIKFGESIPAGTNNIGDVDIASEIPAGTQIIGAVKRDIVNYTKVNHFLNSSDASSATNVWDPTGGTKFVLTDLILSVDTAGWYKIFDSATEIMRFELAANGGVVINLQTPIQSSTADNILKIQAEAAGEVNITVCGYEV